MSYKIVREFARKMRKTPTPAEKYFWQKVRNRQFLGLKFNRQFIVKHTDIANRVTYFIPDFHCFEKKLLVEIDGKIHLYQVEKDAIRENILREMGFQIIRFENEDVLHNWPWVAEELALFIVSL